MTFLGWLSDLLERLSDLQLGDKKVTKNHLVEDFFVSNRISGRLVRFLFGPFTYFQGRKCYVRFREGIENKSEPGHNLGDHHQLKAWGFS